MIRLRTRPHPIAAFLAFMIFGPYLAVIALLILLVIITVHLVAAGLHLLGRHAD